MQSGFVIAEVPGRFTGRFVNHENEHTGSLESENETYHFVQGDAHVKSTLSKLNKVSYNPNNDIRFENPQIE